MKNADLIRIAHGDRELRVGDKIRVMNVEDITRSPYAFGAQRKHMSGNVYIVADTGDIIKITNMDGSRPEEDAFYHDWVERVWD